MLSRYEWSAAQKHQGNGGPYYGFHTYITGTKGTLLVFGEGGGGAIEGVQPAPVILCAPLHYTLQLHFASISPSSCSMHCCRYKDGVESSFDPEDGPDRCWASNNSYYDMAHTNALRHWADCCLDPGVFNAPT